MGRKKGRVKIGPRWSIGVLALWMGLWMRPVLALEAGPLVYDPNRAMNGYTLAGTVGSVTTPPVVVLLDMAGNLVNQWMATGIPAKFLPGGRILARTSLASEEIAFVELDWNGHTVWSLPIFMDHDFEREGNPVGYYAPGADFVANGKTLLMTLEERTVPSISPFPLQDPVLYEFFYDGAWTGFMWRGSDHFEEFGFDDAAKAAIAERGGDYLHMNTVSLVGPNEWYEQGDARFHPENIILCSRHGNFVVIIDRATGAVVWRIGPEFRKDQPEHPIGQLLGPHHAHIIPKGLPGAGHMLIFDNGAPSGYGGFGGYPKYPGRRYSRVVEFDPTTFRVVWEYRADRKSETPFKSMAMGSAQRLPNGNTLITFPNQVSTYPEQGRLVEVTAGGAVVWDLWLQWNQVPVTPYRAYRVPPEWLPAGINPAGYLPWSQTLGP
ncbi:arylsulfotransferase family protein [Desulfosoma sp.]